jgi:hypothetical protein
MRPFLADTEEIRKHLAEVNDELSFGLVPEAGPVSAMSRHFEVPIQSVAERTTEQ